MRSKNHNCSTDTDKVRIRYVHVSYYECSTETVRYEMLNFYSVYHVTRLLQPYFY